jgi:hypothetical protein
MALAHPALRPADRHADDGEDAQQGGAIVGGHYPRLHGVRLVRRAADAERHTGNECHGYPDRCHHQHREPLAMSGFDNRDKRASGSGSDSQGGKEPPRPDLP